MIEIYESTSRTLEKLDEMYNNRYYEIKKLTVYFNQINFLFSEYKINNNNVHMIIENFDGTIVLISGLNCGYIGTGPRGTQEILQKIGFNEQESEKFILNKAIIVEFKEKGKLETAEIKFDYLIESISNRNIYQKNKDYLMRKKLKIYIDDNIKVDLVNRNIYIANPQIKNITNLYMLMDLLEIYKLEYYIGENSNIKESLRYYEIFGKKRFKNFMGVNIAILGNLFNIYCFIDIRSQFEVISSVYYKIFEESLYSNIIENDIIIFSPEYSRMKIFYILFKNIFKKKRKEIYGEKLLDKGIEEKM